MNEQDKPIKENESPVPLPAADEAWNAMRRLLDEHQPEKAIPVFTESGSSGSWKKWLAVAMLLLISSLVTYQILRPVDEDRQAKNLGITTEPETEIKLGKDKAGAENINGHTVQDMNSTGLVADDQSNALNEEKQSARKILSKKNKSGLSSDGKKNDKESSEKNSVTDRDDLVDNEVNGSSESKSAISEMSAGEITSQNNATKKNQAAVRKDSAAVSDKMAEPTVDEPADDWRIAGGLFWTLPLNSVAQYETWSAGPNGKPQPYRLLLPGAWIEAQHERHLMVLELNPFAFGIPKDIPFKYQEGSTQGVDTLIKTYTSHTMLKSFGASFGMGYQYNISGKLWLGGSFQTILWTRAVEQESTVYEKIPSNSNPSVFTAESFNYPMKENWEYFSKFQLNLNADFSYREKNWQTGLRTGFALTPFGQKDGLVHPFTATLYFRWRLFYLEK